MNHSTSKEEKDNCHHHKNGKNNQSHSHNEKHNENHCGMNSTWLWIIIGVGAVVLFGIFK
ncbi:MAG: hypothetical protein ACH0QD_00950 [Tepidibacillus sp.]